MIGRCFASFAVTSHAVVVLSSTPYSWAYSPLTTLFRAAPADSGCVNFVQAGDIFRIQFSSTNALEAGTAADTGITLSPGGALAASMYTLDGAARTISIEVASGTFGGASGVSLAAGIEYTISIGAQVVKDGSADTVEFLPSCCSGSVSRYTKEAGSLKIAFRYRVAAIANSGTPGWTQTATLLGHSGRVRALEHGGGYLMSGGKDGMVYVWTGYGCGIHRTYGGWYGHAGTVWGLKYIGTHGSKSGSANTGLFASAGADGSLGAGIIVWCINDGDGVHGKWRELFGHTNKVRALEWATWTSGEKRLISLSTDGTIKIWDIDQSDADSVESLKTIEWSGNVVVSGFALAFQKNLPSGKAHVAVASPDIAKIQLWDVNDVTAGKITPASTDPSILLDGHTYMPWEVKWLDDTTSTSDTPILFSCAGDEYVIVWDTVTTFKPAQGLSNVLEVPATAFAAGATTTITAAGHTLVTGDYVEIVGAAVEGLFLNVLGFWSVTVVDENSFTIPVDTTGEASTPDLSAAKVKMHGACKAMVYLTTQSIDAPMSGIGSVVTGSASTNLVAAGCCAGRVRLWDTSTSSAWTSTTTLSMGSSTGEVRALAWTGTHLAVAADTKETVVALTAGDAAKLTSLKNAMCPGGVCSTVLSTAWADGGVAAGAVLMEKGCFSIDFMKVDASAASVASLTAQGITGEDGTTGTCTADCWGKIGVSNIIASGTDAVITTTINHGYVVGDWITLDGLTPVGDLLEGTNRQPGVWVATRFTSGMCIDTYGCTEVQSSLQCSEIRALYEVEWETLTFTSGNYEPNESGEVAPSGCFYKVATKEVFWNARVSPEAGTVAREKVCMCPPGHRVIEVPTTDTFKIAFDLSSYTISDVTGTAIKDTSPRYETRHIIYPTSASNIDQIDLAKVEGVFGCTGLHFYVDGHGIYTLRPFVA